MVHTSTRLIVTYYAFYFISFADRAGCHVLYLDTLDIVYKELEYLLGFVFVHPHGILVLSTLNYSHTSIISIMHCRCVGKLSQIIFPIHPLYIFCIPI